VKKYRGTGKAEKKKSNFTEFPSIFGNKQQTISKPASYLKKNLIQNVPEESILNPKLMTPPRKQRKRKNNPIRDSAS